MLVGVASNNNNKWRVRSVKEVDNKQNYINEEKKVEEFVRKTNSN